MAEKTKEEIVIEVIQDVIQYYCPPQYLWALDAAIEALEERIK